MFIQGKSSQMRSGSTFSDAMILQVWLKGRAVIGYDPRIWRMDTCGAFIKWSDYGNTTSEFGWEVDHIKPVEKYGSDDLINLQPLHWKNNRHKSDHFPSWTCAISAV